MDPKQKNTVLLGALIAGVLAFFLPWVTFKLDSTEVSGFARVALMFGGGEATLSAFNGTVHFLGVTAPLWFILSLALVANLLPLLNHTQHFAIPRSLEGILAFLALIWVASVVVLGLLKGSEGVKIELGWVLAMVCASSSVYCFLRARPRP